MAKSHVRTSRHLDAVKVQKVRPPKGRSGWVGGLKPGINGAKWKLNRFVRPSSLVLLRVHPKRT